MTVRGKRTPLYERHRALGARIAEFAGWDMPISYRGIIDEHRAVRRGAGLFDISHMGFVELCGADAGAACQGLTSNDVRRLSDGRAQYSLLCNERGGIVDDIIVYRLNTERYAVCVNAANVDTDVTWMREHARGHVQIVDKSHETALLALQGPRAVDVLAAHTATPVGRLPGFGHTQAIVAGVPAMVARTGYTGGDGFEIFLSSARVSEVWDALLKNTKSIEPAGLGARDTLRLEAGLLLHGADMGPETSALEAGLGWVVKLNAGWFIGRDALAAEAGVEPSRRLVRILLRASGVPRRGYSIAHDGRTVGTVTSGTLSPMLRAGIALGYVDTGYNSAGTPVTIAIRHRDVDAEIVRGPFFRPGTGEPDCHVDGAVNGSTVG